MTISSLNGVIAGMQTLQYGTRFWTAPPANRPIDLWYGSGINNSAGAADTTLNGVVLSSSAGVLAGQIPRVDAPGGASAYIARATAMNSVQTGIAAICDRLWHNGGITITSTSLQSIVSPAWPLRDSNGTSNGEGVYVGLSVSATTGAGTPTAVLSYTNSTGASGRTSSLIDVTVGSSTVGMFYRFGLQSGDTGIQSVQGITFTGPWASGTVNLVAYRILATLDVDLICFASAVDPITSGLPQVYNGTVPFWMMLSSGTNSSLLTFSYAETQG